jgi:diguanylate cyclase (GGDEF)-like protein
VTPPSPFLVTAGFLAVGLLAGLDTIEHVPALAIRLPEAIYSYEVYDLLALGIVFLTARSFSRRTLIGPAGLFILLHVPGAVLSFPHNTVEIVRTLLISGGLVVGLYLTQRWRDSEARLAGLALRDSITGLPNNRQFYSDLEHFLGETRRYGTTGAVLFIDLDKFKAINDIYGHRAGDEFLRALAGWLRGCLRASDWVARIGGDEFAAILAHVDPQAAAVVAERIRATDDLQEARFEGKALRSTASIGIARIPEDGTTLDDVLGHADAAMYLAKAKGGNRAEFYSD